MYDEFFITGPYKRPDGRYHLVLRHKITNRKTTLSYPKYLLERKLGRYLENYETVHHIDGNVANNSLDNLVILDRDIHAKLDIIKRKSETFICPICGKKFTVTGKRLNDITQNRKRGKAGPFCGRSCAGKYGALVQHGKMEKLEVVQVNKSYYKDTYRVPQEKS